MGQEIEVRPGIVSKDHEGKLMCKPIFSKIVSLFAEHNDLQYAAPGGLIGTYVRENLFKALLVMNIVNKHLYIFIIQLSKAIMTDQTVCRVFTDHHMYFKALYKYFCPVS